MTSIDVVGGVYGERCAFPYWNQIYGSAGRAAVALSAHVDAVRLHTVLPEDHAKRISPNFETFDVELRARAGTQLIGFDYLHCLADPVISPSPAAIHQQDSFKVEAEVAVVFGMMECIPKVNANVCVYDPQSPINPRGFKVSGGEAKRLAFVANAEELRKLSGKDGIEGAEQVLLAEDAEIVIIKKGLDGATIVGAQGVIGTVPAYKTEYVFSVFS